MGRQGGAGSISIHAPREGSDSTSSCVTSCATSISIHAPREGSDLVSLRLAHPFEISIHAPREGSDTREAGRRIRQKISIHAPREGSDGAGAPGSRWRERFLSTLPVRGATMATYWVRMQDWISIHAPREGSDWLTPGGFLLWCLISIHAPREGSDVGRPTARPSGFNFYPRSP